MGPPRGCARSPTSSPGHPSFSLDSVASRSTSETRSGCPHMRLRERRITCHAGPSIGSGLAPARQPLAYQPIARAVSGAAGVAAPNRTFAGVGGFLPFASFAGVSAAGAAASGALSLPASLTADGADGAGSAGTAAAVTGAFAGAGSGFVAGTGSGGITGCATGKGALLGCVLSAALLSGGALLGGPPAASVGLAAAAAGGGVPVLASAAFNGVLDDGALALEAAASAAA